jgi:hypothetical protein
MRRIFMLMLAQSIAIILFAQTGDPVDPKNDKIEFEGYTIRLIPAMGGTYGYDILKGNSLVVHQSMNPFTMEPMGLRKKNDAYKVARWQVQQLKEQNPQGFSPPGHAPRRPSPATVQPRFNQSIPKKVAGELNIKLTPPY